MSIHNSNGLIPEWGPQQATMIVWPHITTDWAPWIDDITNTYVQFADIITHYQKLVIICKTPEHESHIQAQLANTSNSFSIQYIHLAYNDTWCRDYGPLSVYREGAVELLDFAFNGWGDKYDATDDNLLCRRLDYASHFSHQLSTIDFHLEGGSIDSNGAGLLLTTSACLLSGTRNNAADKALIESTLSEYLHFKRLLWLDHGSLVGDDTDCHIDNLARFTSPDTVVYAATPNTKDANHHPLAAMEQELQALNQRHNLGLTLIPIAIPEAQFDTATGARLPASYINFVMVNGAVIIPCFDTPQDESALEIFTNLFPDRDIVPIIGNHFIKQFGGPHCASMQLAENTISNKR
ncbi:hypothetical protein A9Q99_09455 [Gammaproteobacteria bacterium 45_16_T64]|nr:hypothetical protein A9Q99_09455 [Gammaproteobacteria bacterium 45_16_T64]